MQLFPNSCWSRERLRWHLCKFHYGVAAMLGGGDNETKYFLSNAPDDVPLNKILCVAFSRFHIEHLFREAKTAVGLDEFQVRQYRPLMRHLILSTLSVLFLAEETEKLRGEKSVVVAVPGSGSGGSPTRPSEIAGRANPSPEEDPRPHCLSSTGSL